MRYLPFYIQDNNHTWILLESFHRAENMLHEWCTHQYLQHNMNHIVYRRSNPCFWQTLTCIVLQESVSTPTATLRPLSCINTNLRKEWKKVWRYRLGPGAWQYLITTSIIKMATINIVTGDIIAMITDLISPVTTIISAITHSIKADALLMYSNVIFTTSKLSFHVTFVRSRIYNSIQNHNDWQFRW